MRKRRKYHTWKHSKKQVQLSTPVGNEGLGQCHRTSSRPEGLLVITAGGMPEQSAEESGKEQADKERGKASQSLHCHGEGTGSTNEYIPAARSAPQKHT